MVAAVPALQEWKTVEYQGVQIGIPSAWERLDMSDCEFQFQLWAPPDSPPCRFEGGVVFYGSAIFDPAHRPGIRRTASNGTDTASWAGYAYAGNYAVYVLDADRNLVQKVLDSAWVTGGKSPGVR